MIKMIIHAKFSRDKIVKALELLQEEDGQGGNQVQLAHVTQSSLTKEIVLIDSDCYI